MDTMNETHPPARNARAEFEALRLSVRYAEQDMSGATRGSDLYLMRLEILMRAQMHLCDFAEYHAERIAAALDTDARPLSIFGLPDGSTTIISAEATPDTLPDSERRLFRCDGQE